MRKLYCPTQFCWFLLRGLFCEQCSWVCLRLSADCGGLPFAAAEIVAANDVDASVSIGVQPAVLHKATCADHGMELIEAIGMFLSHFTVTDLSTMRNLMLSHALVNTLIWVCAMFRPSPGSQSQASKPSMPTLVARFLYSRSAGIQLPH